MSNSVLPDPAGACTMNDADVSSARMRASLSAIIFELPDAAEGALAAVITGARFGVDIGAAGAEIGGQFFESGSPVRDHFREFRLVGELHFFKTGERDSRSG